MKAKSSTCLRMVVPNYGDDLKLKANAYKRTEGKISFCWRIDFSNLTVKHNSWVDMYNHISTSMMTNIYLGQEIIDNLKK